MPHWRTLIERPSREMVLWRRGVILLAGWLIGTGLALLLWGLS